MGKENEEVGAVEELDEALREGYKLDDDEGDKGGEGDPGKQDPPKDGEEGKEAKAGEEEGAKKPDDEKKEDPAPEDPEIELQIGDQTIKCKQSDYDGYLKTIKRKIGDKELSIEDLEKTHETFTKKTQDISERESKLEEILVWSDRISKNPTLSKAIQTLSEKGYTDPQFLANMVKALDGSDAAQEKIEDALDKELEELDLDTPEGKLVKKQHEQIKGLVDDLKEIKEAVTANKTAQTERDSTDADTARTKQFDNSKRIWDDALGAIKKSDDYKFDSDEERSHHLAATSAVIATLARSKEGAELFKDEEAFTLQINKAAKEEYAKLQGIKKAHGDRILADHLKGKKTKVPQGPGGGGEKEPKKVTLDNLEEAVISDLAEMNAENIAAEAAG